LKNHEPRNFKRFEIRAKGPKPHRQNLSSPTTATNSVIQGIIITHDQWYFSAERCGYLEASPQSTLKQRTDRTVAERGI